ncbi:MAG: preprotein translocase subunit SecG [Thiotrichaceae bacterium]
MYNILLIIQILVAIGIIGLVLMQHGKGADAGAAFGGGGSAGGAASGSVFGARGAGNFLSRTTAVLAFAFFVNSMALAWLVSHRGDTATSDSIVDSVLSVEKTAAPVVDTAPGDVPDAPESASPSMESTESDVSDVPEAESAAPTESATDDVPTAEATGSMADDVPDAPVKEEKASKETESAKE